MSVHKRLCTVKYIRVWTPQLVYIWGPCTGADPEIEEGGGGGGIHIEGGLVRRVWDAVVCVRASRVVASLQYVAQKPEKEATYIEHVQSCRGVWGHAPPGKF